MSTTNPSPEKGIAQQTTLADLLAERADECDECAALPGEWPCADCYIGGDATLP